MGSGGGGLVLRRALGVLGLAIAAAAWFYLGPQYIGGPVVYTVITGQSMEPLLKADDLVLVREQQTYRVGDVVAYRSRNLHQVVLHRIVARENNRFVLKGDNNDFLDGDQPTEAEILGKLWVQVPQAGSAFTYLRSPVGMSLGAVAILGILGFFSVAERRRIRRGRHRRATAESREAVPSDIQPEGPTIEAPTREGATPEVHTVGKRRSVSEKRRPLQIAVAMLAALLLVSGGFIALALSWSPFRAAPRTIAYEHTGTFAYAAPSPEGPVYQEPEITAGDPVFLQLVDRLEVTFDYALEAEVEDDVDLTGRLDAVLASDNGWHRTINLASGEASQVDHLRLSGELDLARTSALLRNVEDLTGMAPGSYALSIKPEIEAVGTIAGQEVADRFSPELAFELDEIQLTLTRPERDGATVGLAEVLRPRSQESLKVVGSVPNPLVVAGVRIPLETGRRLALGVATIALIGLVVISIIMLRRRPRGEAARIEARHGSFLIPVGEAPALRHEMVDVDDIDALVRLAEQFEQPILHQESESGVHRYMVHYDGLVYHYATQEPHGERTPSPEVPVDEVDPQPVPTVEKAPSLTARPSDAPDRDIPQ